MNVPYVGNGHYCYANTASMLLASIGEAVPPAQFEALTGVGLGATWLRGEGIALFGVVAPDVGFSRALDLLGFDYEERSGADGDPLPLDELRRELASGAIALGPLDVGCLRYRPSARGPSGADHYVLAYALDGEELHLHDPAGFPHVSLRLPDLEEAWRAERVGGRRGAFRRWLAPRRRERVAAAALVDRAQAWFASIYYRAGEPGAAARRLTGPRALDAFAADLRRGAVTPAQAGHMRQFLFQLAAKRALDYAAFFERHRPELAALKRQQAGLFGRGHTLAVRGQWAAVAAAVEEIATIEQTLGAAFVGAAAPAADRAVRVAARRATVTPAIPPA